MQIRFNAYVDAVRRDLMSPMFGDLDGLVVLADLLSALHRGQAGFDDARSALAAAADALRWDRSWADWLAAFARLKLPPRAIRRVAFAATKADHIAARRRNPAALMLGTHGRTAARNPPPLRCSGALHGGCGGNAGGPPGFCCNGRIIWRTGRHGLSG